MTCEAEFLRVEKSTPGELVAAVEHHSDRAGIMDLHILVLLKATGPDRQAAAAGEFDTVIEKTFRLIGRSSGGEIRPAAATSIRHKGELADEEETPIYVNHGEIEPVFFIGEDAQVDDLLDDVIGVPFGITLGDADKHDQPRPDAPRLLAGDADAGPADALHKGFHAALLLASEPDPDDDEPESDDLDEEVPAPDEPEEEASRWSVT